MSYFKKALKYAGMIVLAVLAVFILLLIYVNIPVSTENKDAQLGVTFSSRYASDIGLDWKEAYLAMLDDLNIRKIRIPVYWDLAEKKEGEYDFADVDWQLKEARKRNAEIILVVGQKVPRWPECFIPEWVGDDKGKKEEKLLRFMEVVVKEYKNNPEIKYWQIENEPFLNFGICPAFDKNFLDREIALVKKLDPSREVIVTASGEISIWSRSAKRGDILGTTLYRTIWKEGIGYFDYPIGPRFFHLKYFISKILTGNERAFVVELQGEPWVSGYTTNEPLEEQFKSMNVGKLKENVSFARKVGFPEIYLWGVEWWYWLKVKKDHPELWDAARDLFAENSAV
ncbi:MAG: hypothetical protein QG620_248 [Patescibacteria group bacterium]|nr:hypothetical protein [Patescibacteria group bacterium]